MALLVLAGLLAWLRWDARRQVDTAERARLDQQAAAIEHNLTRQLGGIDKALRSVRTDLPFWLQAKRLSEINLRLTALRDAMPGVRNMHLLDAEGQVVASSVAGYVGGDLVESANFRQARERRDPTKLYVSEPFRSRLGDYTLKVMLVVPGAPGGFDGVIVATLNPDYFDTVLASALYAPDMWGGVAHANGQVLLYNPPGPHALAKNLAYPGSLFMQHKQSGRSASVLVGRLASGELRMVAQRTLLPADVSMDQPLYLAVTRDMQAIFAPWLRQTRLDAAVLMLVALGSVLMLLALQRRRAQLEDLGRVAQAQHAADAERVALALRGGDLALWDAHLPSGQGVVNERWYTMLGYTPAPGNTDASAWEALLHPDDRARVLAAQQAHLDGSTEAYDAIYRLRHGAGHWVWVLDRGRVVERMPDGRPVRMVGTHMDITRRMEAEEALRRNERSLAITLHSIGDAVIATDPQGLVTRINAMAERLTGWPAAQALGQPLHTLFRIFNAGNREPAQDPVALVLAQGQTVGTSNDTVLVARDGTEHQIAHSAAPIRAESRDVLGNRPDNVLGHVSGNAFGDMPGDVPSDGPGVVLGDILGIVLVFSDVSAHYRMLQALREREAQLTTVTAALPGPVARLDMEGRHVFSNAACERWFGLSPAQAVGRDWREILGAELQALVEPEMQAALAGETRNFDATLPTLDGPRDTMVTLVPDRDDAGKVCGCFLVVNDITERKRAQEDARRLELERQALQSQLRDAQKMESIGTLAGGIAHDFNNILPAILGNVALATADLPPGHPALLNLAQINKAGLRARSLVQQILTFSRRQPTALQPQPLRPVVEETLALLRSTLPAAVQLATQLADETLVVQADATQLQQVLMNLCTNAWHAVQHTPAPTLDGQGEQGGLNLGGQGGHSGQSGQSGQGNRGSQARGRIEVGMQPLTAEQAAALALSELPAGPCVHVWVADNGCGMQPAVRARIFDPFFTTKPVGHGTGLGLSVAHGIVRSHRGAITVDSTPGQGSSFHVYLPLQPVPDMAPSPGVPQVPDALGSGQQVLYVDDDEVMVVLVQRLLARAGYGVVVCGDAPAALALVQAQPQRFDLVVTDYNMPDMSGLELAQALVMLAPGLPMIISSGYLTDALREQAKALGVKALLRKENTLERLPALVHEVLAGRR